MAQLHTVTVVDQSYVAPPPGSVPTTTVPLTFFDVAWLLCSPMQRIFFYDFPCPTSHFTQTILPNLKQSLSLTLRHFFPFVANLTCPPPPNKPYILYKDGDSIPVIGAESVADFHHLISNSARENIAFKSLVPKLQTARFSSDETHVVPIMAMQVTVFPNAGLSIGITFNHTAADGRSFNHFMKSWASIHRSGGEDLTFLPLPCHNRDLIKDPDEFASIFLNDVWSFAKYSGSNATPVAVLEDNVRVTLVLSRTQIQKLKEWLANKGRDNKQGTIRMSTFTVTCAFMWVNLIRLKESETKGHLNDDKLYHFLAAADGSGRIPELPIPTAYFGNCLIPLNASVKRSELMGENGIVVAAEAISRAIFQFEKGPLIGAEKWMSDLFKKFKSQGSLFTVAGSPKLQVYETDFRWGKPRKGEVAHIGANEFFSLNECREEEGGIEIGFVIGRDKLSLFNSFLTEHQLNIQ